MRRLALLLSVLSVLSGTGILVGIPARADMTVTLQNNQFEPRDLIIKASESVTWINNDGTGHSVTSDNQSFDSSPRCGDTALGTCMEKGHTYTRNFPTKGTYRYHCRVHGEPGTGMYGTVTVT